MKNTWSSWWWEWHFVPHCCEAQLSFPGQGCWCGGDSWLAQDSGKQHGVGRVGAWFCLCKMTHNNILRYYGVPLTVQMEESVKFPGDINAFPTPTHKKRWCVFRQKKAWENKEIQMFPSRNNHFVNQVRIHSNFWFKRWFFMNTILIIIWK